MQHDVIVTFVFRVAAETPVSATKECMAYFTDSLSTVFPVEQNTRVVSHDAELPRRRNGHGSGEQPVIMS
jgi:hypothetical protein